MESIIMPIVGWFFVDPQGDLGGLAIIWIKIKILGTFLHSCLNSITLCHHFILSVWYWNLVNNYAFNRKGKRKSSLSCLAN